MASCSTNVHLSCFVALVLLPGARNQTLEVGPKYGAAHLHLIKLSGICQAETTPGP